MRQIVSPISLTKKILGQQKVDERISYRITAHCVRIEQPEGLLFYHTLTGELLLLTHEEEALLAKLPGSAPPVLTELVSRRFLVPEGADEMALVDQVRNIARRLKRGDGILTDYLIFTTTACNARCFYCFEAGIQKTTMTKETARAAGEYIATHCGGKPVHLVWFGGEPLLNVKAIDAITDVLRQRGVEFRSRMDSNGYLFDEALAARIKNNWGLYQVQITLDGTEEVYNQRKAYVHPEGSPFQRVLRNISSLLDAGIQVTVRMNMDEDNERDLYVLVDELAGRFAGRPGFVIAPRVIIENKGAKPYRYTEEERRTLADKARDMWDYLDRRGVAVETSLTQQPVFYSCWSDNANAATITPEGRLGRCESHIDKGLWGSVFSEERDEEVLRQWRKRRLAEEICSTCELYPRCVRLKNCVVRTERCSAIEREEMGIRLERGILKAYVEWKEGRPSGADTI